MEFPSELPGLRRFWQRYPCLLTCFTAVALNTRYCRRHWRQVLWQEKSFTISIVVIVAPDVLCVPNRQQRVGPLGALQCLTSAGINVCNLAASSEAEVLEYQKTQHFIGIKKRGTMLIGSDRRIRRGRTHYELLLSALVVLQLHKRCVRARLELTRNVQLQGSHRS